MACALRTAVLRRSSSLPSARVRQGPEASLKASPNLAWGTVLTTASYISSAVLMKCVWPTLMLLSEGISSGTASSSSIWHLLPTLARRNSAKVLTLRLFCRLAPGRGPRPILTEYAGENPVNVAQLALQIEGALQLCAGNAFGD